MNSQQRRVKRRKTAAFLVKARVLLQSPMLGMIAWAKENPFPLRNTNK